jgi:hypothetical protein
MERNLASHEHIHIGARLAALSRRKTPGKGSRLRNSETFRITGNYDSETRDQARDYAKKHGVSLAEALRHLVEFGLEAVHNPPQKGNSDASAAQNR